MTEEVSFKLQHLPESPGCYLMKSRGEVIYVGKAKNLKNRVRQYFQSSRDHTPKVRAMVSRVDDFDIVLVDGELEALILECNLIKKHMPFYNILLKDDKQYPYIAIDPKEPYPRVQLRRRIENDGCRYFGPYSGANVVREVMDVVRMVFPIRPCRKTIRPDPRFRPCVYHDVGQCQAPCAGRISEEDYGKLVKKVIEFLSGNFEPVIAELKSRMTEAANALQYEKAARYRDRIHAVEQLTQKQKAVTTAGGDEDVLALMPEGDDMLVQVMAVREGKLLDASLHVMERSADEAQRAVLTSFMLQHYGENRAIPSEILLPCLPEETEILQQLLQEKRGKRVYLHVPVRGEKRRMVEMAQKNLRDAIEKRRSKLEKSYRRTTGALVELAEALGLECPPRRIEGYDISNTQGSQSVSSMVVMIDGVAAHKEYRHFRIKTVQGPNDFASMRETIDRRFRHGLEERQEREAEGLSPIGGKFSDLPDLVLIDGGAIQLREAVDAMRANGLEIPMFGLAKRLEEIVLPDQETTILLDRHSEALQIGRAHV